MLIIVLTLITGKTFRKLSTLYVFEILSGTVPEFLFSCKLFMHFAKIICVKYVKMYKRYVLAFIFNILTKN